jgi:excisionase family DNA binding protein
MDSTTLTSIQPPSLIQPTLRLPRLAYGVVEVAVLLGASTDTIRNWIASGKLAATKAPGPKGKVMVTAEALERFLDGLEKANHIEAVGV